MLLNVYSMGGVKVLGLVTGFGDVQSLLYPIDGGICDMKPGESKDNILLATAYDIEEMFWGNPFNVDK